MAGRPKFGPRTIRGPALSQDTLPSLFPYPIPCQVLIQTLYHFYRVWYDSKYESTGLLPPSMRQNKGGKKNVFRCSGAPCSFKDRRISNFRRIVNVLNTRAVS